MVAIAWREQELQILQHVVGSSSFPGGYFARLKYSSQWLLYVLSLQEIKILKRGL
jgi:hypothetical protein